MSKEKTAFIPKQYFAVVAVLLAIMMSVLDGTIMNIALPTLAHDFDITPSNAIWIVNAYQLVITMTLLSFASLGDIYGYRRIFLTGISIFRRRLFGLRPLGLFLDADCLPYHSRFRGGLCNECQYRPYPFNLPAADTRGRGMGVNAMVVAVSGRRRSIHCRQYLSIGKLALAFW